MFLNKIKKDMELKSQHIVAVDFSLDTTVKNTMIEGFGAAEDLPMMRVEQEGKRFILINKHSDAYDSLSDYLVSLDKLPVIVIMDIYKQYIKKYRTLTTANVQASHENETCKRLVFVLVIEILWCNGSDIKSRIFS